MSISQSEISSLMGVIVRAEAASAQGKHYEAIRCWNSASRIVHEIGRDITGEMLQAAWMLKKTLEANNAVRSD